MRYVTLDVFTDAPFGGNPLAVVLEADRLDGGQMQRIAAEFGYSETTFVSAPTQPGFDARVRIFTPTLELGFAGHPNVGTALVLAEGDRTLRFEEGVGPVTVEVRRGVAEVAAPQPFRVLGNVAADVIARACGVDGQAVVGDPVVATCGTAVVLAEVQPAALVQARPAAPVDALGALGVLLYHGRAPVRARMFAPAAGVAEDPATGSAALALAGLFAQHAGPGMWAIEQGVEIGRPSVLTVRADGSGAAWVAGSAVVMMRGSLTGAAGVDVQRLP